MMVEFILASQSPRRQALFGLIQKPFFALPADIEERREVGENPEAYVVRMATMKAEDVEHRVANSASPQLIILAADTTVVDEGEILGKPTNPAQARDILEQLRGKSHSVFSGIAVRQPLEGLTLTELVRTEVVMRDYTDEEIEAYIDTGDPFDKAGAYAIQNENFHLVQSWEGCYTNVMGLPLCHVERVLANLGVPLSTQVPVQCQDSFSVNCQIPGNINTAEYAS